MKLFLCSNGYTEKQTRQAIACLDMLQNLCGHECAVSPSESQHLFGDLSRAAFPAGESELIVSLGGDGAVLRAAKIAIAAHKPLIGINSGRLGYLCALEFGEIARFNEILPACALSRRLLLEARCGADVHTAVNDIVIAKKSFGEAVDLNVSIGGETLRLRGDGLIFATPTGSTAYSYSARGPLVDPEMSAFALTPICPHGTFDHSIVLGCARTVTVSSANDSAVVYADGAPIPGDCKELTISPSSENLALYSSGAVQTGILKLF